MLTDVYLRIYTCAQVDIYHIHLIAMYYAHLRNILIQLLTTSSLVAIVIDEQSFWLRCICTMPEGTQRPRVSVAYISGKAQVPVL